MQEDPVLSGGGELGALMRGKDWSQTPLGPVRDWSPVLRTHVGTLLASPYPMALYWGREEVFLYNDAFSPVIGVRHPSALGVPASHSFAEIWDYIGPMLAGVRDSGVASFLEDRPVFLARQGFPEECFFTWSYIPVRDEAHRTVGLLGIASETTGKVLGDRRFKALRELSIHTARAQDVDGVLRASREVLADMGSDVPFALLYGLEGERARLLLRTGLAEDADAAPGEVRLADPGAWPLAEALRSGQGRVLEALGARWGALPGGPWPEPAHRALLVPLSLGVGAEPDAVLVLGLSPRLPLDEGYRDFLGLLARQLAADAARVRALAQEKRRAEQLAELNHAKTAFFSNISHEFRTPLTLMLGPLEDALASPERALRDDELERVRRNALRLSRLVNTLLEYSRLEAGRMRAHFQPTELSALTTGLVSAFDSAVARAGLRLEVDCPPLSEPVWVDRDCWEKVVLNLLSNALKFTHAGSIRVGQHGRPGHVELTVHDTGTGIAPEERPRLFERFHQIRGTRGRSHEGTGIGLALVRELVELHGGHVRVESTPGQGSTFTVSVPTGHAHLPPEQLDAPTPPRPPGIAAEPFLLEVSGWLEGVRPAPPGTPRPGRPLALEPRTPEGHVLLVEDSADMRDYVRRLLQGRYSLELVADGQAALEAARVRVPDLVLSDVMMPGMDGFALVHALRASPRTASVPILLLSARAGEEARLEGLQSGADDYLVKPFGARELLARVEASLRLARERNARERLVLDRADLERHLIGIVSHDLRNPLNAISLSAAQLRRHEALDEGLRRPVERILSSAERAQRMIHDLLDFTRARLGGGLPVHQRTLDFHLLAQQVLEELRAAAPGRELCLEQQGDGQVVWDGDRVAQVLTNLVTNALHYSPPGTPVRVRTWGEADTGVLEVHNEGPPISSDMRSRLFQPLQRGEQGGGARRSVGLGLYIVEQLARAHGGLVEVRSEPGEGTTFRVRLPRHSPASRDGRTP